MNTIDETEFARICAGIRRDAAAICRYNPIGTRQETLLWMLLGCLNSYLSLSEIETPCFTGKPDAETYKNAVLFVLKNRRREDFGVEDYLDEMLVDA